jgi:hypothetical protein
VNVMFNVFSINHHLFLLIEDIFLLEVKMSWYFPKTQPIIHLRSYNSHFNYKVRKPNRNSNYNRAQFLRKQHCLLL